MYIIVDIIGFLLENAGTRSFLARPEVRRTRLYPASRERSEKS